MGFQASEHFPASYRHTAEISPQPVETLAMTVIKRLMVPLILALSICLPGCTKSVTSIGPFDGVWYMTVTGTNWELLGRCYVTVTVEETSFSEAADIYLTEERFPTFEPPDWDPDSIKYHLTLSGNIQPNGTVEGIAKLEAYNASKEYNNGRGQIHGALNTNAGIGSGSFRIRGKPFEWIAVYSDRQ